MTVNGRLYDVYIPSAMKPAQYFYYTCEFDSAWVIMKTFGVDVPFEDQLAIVGYNQDPEPFWTDTPTGLVITGGDIGENFCGDYTSNLVAKIRGSAMKKVFDAYDFRRWPSKSVKTSSPASLRAASSSSSARSISRNTRLRSGQQPTASLIRFPSATITPRW